MSTRTVRPRRPSLRFGLRVVAVLLVPVLVGVGCGGSSARHAAPPRPVVAVDDGAMDSTLVPAASAYPGGSRPRAVVRDCGLSAPLPSGQTLWVFCDTAYYDDITGTPPALQATVSFVGSATAALATTSPAPTAARPIALHEATFPAVDGAFLGSSGTYGPSHRPIRCAGGVPPRAWSGGLVTLPGRNQVLDFYQDHCPVESAGYPSYDVGIAEYQGGSSTGGDVTNSGGLHASVQHDSVLVNPHPGSTEGWGYGHGALVDGAYLYVYEARPGRYDCSSTALCKQIAAGSVTVARVAWRDGEYLSAANYRYFTGQDRAPWVANPARAVDLLSDQAWPAGDGLSVAWYPQIGHYVMAHSDSPVGGGTGLDLRTAPTPWGPWSRPLDVSPQARSSLANPQGGCHAPTTCRTYILHPELTGASGRLYFSYIRDHDLASATGALVTVAGDIPWQVRIGSIPLATLLR